MRKNGFTLPFSNFQIASWLMIAILISTYYIFILPALNNTLKVVSLVLFTLNTIITILIALKCTYIDPIDSAISSETPDEFVSKICTICRASVHENSKHCGECNKCVEYFDHHCKLLNNCIGKANYKYFIVLVISLESISLGYLSLVIFLIVAVSQKSSEYDRLTEYFSTSDAGIQILSVFFGITLILGLIVLVFNSYLIGLHSWLKSKNLTTYQYILILRKQKAEVTYI